MEFTNLDYFNHYLKEFLNELVANFPDHERAIVDNYRPLLEAQQSKDDQYVKYFLSRSNDHMEKICNKDESLFNRENYTDTEELILIEGIDFLSLWNSEFNNDENQTAIWKYLQLLVLFGRKTVPSHEEALEIINNVGGQVYVPGKVEKTMASNDESGDADNGGMFGNMASMMEMFTKLNSGDSGEVTNGITDLISNMMGNIDFSQLEESLKGMMDGMAQASETTDDNTENDETTPNFNDTNDDVVTDELDNTETTTPTNTPTNTETTSNNEQNGQQNGQKDNLFAEMAEDVMKSFNLEDFNQEGKEPDIGQVFSKLFSGDSSAKLGNLLGKYGPKLSQQMGDTPNLGNLFGDLTKGMDEATLKKQAKKMRNNPQAQQMARNLQRQKSSHGQATRNRLKAKLEAKKREQEQK